MSRFYQDDSYSFFDEASCGLFTCQKNGNIIGFNQTLSNWLAIGPDDLTESTHFYNFLTVGGRIYCETHFFPMIQMHGSVKEINLDLLTREKHQLPVLINARMIHRTNESPIIQGIVIDISHRKLYERELLLAKKESEEYAQQLKRINEELSGFAHTVAHDLKSPVNNITGLLSVIKSQNPDTLSTDSLSFIQLALDQGDRIRNFINELLQYAAAGNADLAMEKVNLASVLNQVKENLAQLVKDHSVQLKINLEQAVVHGSELELSRLFQNLIENAIKYRHPERDPEIIIAVVVGENSILTSVQDNGIGIPPDFLDSIFKVFTRVNSTTKTSGSGIGLATCKRIVERHHAEIWVESEYGSGSKFYINFPAPSPN